MRKFNLSPSHLTTSHSSLVTTPGSHQKFEGNSDVCPSTLAATRGGNSTMKISSNAPNATLPLLGNGGPKWLICQKNIFSQTHELLFRNNISLPLNPDPFKRLTLPGAAKKMIGLSFQDFMKNREGIRDLSQFATEFAYEACKQVIQGFKGGKKISISEQSFVFVSANDHPVKGFRSSDLQLMYPVDESRRPPDPRSGRTVDAAPLFRSSVRCVFKMVNQLLVGKDTIGSLGCDPAYRLSADLVDSILDPIPCPELREMIKLFCLPTARHIEIIDTVEELDSRLLSGAIVNQSTGRIYWLKNDPLLQVQSSASSMITAKIHGNDALVLISDKPDSLVVHEGTVNDCLRPFNSPHLLPQVDRGLFKLYESQNGQNVKSDSPRQFHGSVYQYGESIAQFRDYDSPTLYCLACHTIEGMRTAFCAGLTFSEISERSLIVCTDKKGQKVAKLSGLEHCLPFNMQNCRVNTTMAAELVYSLCSGGRRIPWMGRQIASERWCITDRDINGVISLLLDGIFTGGAIDNFLHTYGGSSMDKLSPVLLREVQFVATPTTVEREAAAAQVTPPVTPLTKTNSTSCDDLALLGFPREVGSPEDIQRARDSLSSSYSTTAPSTPILESESSENLADWEVIDEEEVQEAQTESPPCQQDLVEEVGLGVDWLDWDWMFTQDELRKDRAAQQDTALGGKKRMREEVPPAINVVTPLTKRTAKTKKGR